MSVVDEVQPTDGAYRSAVLDLTSYYPTSMFHRLPTPHTQSSATTSTAASGTHSGLQKETRTTTTAAPAALEVGRAPLLQRYLPRRPANKTVTQEKPKASEANKNTTNTGSNSTRTTSATRLTRSAFASSSPALQRRRSLSVSTASQQAQPQAQSQAQPQAQPQAQQQGEEQTEVRAAQPTCAASCSATPSATTVEAQRNAASTSAAEPATEPTVNKTTKSSTPLVCSDAHCIHSRGAIAEFVAMQGELRRCYEAMAAQAAHTHALQEALQVAQAALQEAKAQHAQALQMATQRRRVKQRHQIQQLFRRHHRRHDVHDGRRARLTRALLDAVSAHPSPLTEQHPAQATCEVHDAAEAEVKEAEHEAKEEVGQTTEVLLSESDTPTSLPPSRRHCEVCIETTRIETADAATNTPDEAIHNVSRNNKDREQQAQVIVALRAQCEELVRALLDKERQLASVAAERTRLGALCANKAHEGCDAVRDQASGWQ